MSKSSSRSSLSGSICNSGGSWCSVKLISIASALPAHSVVMLVEETPAPGWHATASKETEATYSYWSNRPLEQEKEERHFGAVLQRTMTISARSREEATSRQGGWKCWQTSSTKQLRLRLPLDWALISTVGRGSWATWRCKRIRAHKKSRIAPDDSLEAC